jgi:hypothetical protein
LSWKESFDSQSDRVGPIAHPYDFNLIRRSSASSVLALCGHNPKLSGLVIRNLKADGPNAVANVIGYAKFYSRSHHAMIHVYDDAGNVIQTHEHAGGFKEW